MDNAEKTQKEYTGPERLKPHIFTSTNQPAKRGRHKGSSPTDYLKKLARVKIDFQNPLTGKVETAPVALVVAIQLILKATQDSDLPSIREFFDRLDGKVPQKLESNNPLVEFNNTTIVQQIRQVLENDGISDKSRITSITQPL